MVAFRDLWYRHPANNSTQYPCIAPHGLTNMEGKAIPPGFPVFGNQCAIRMGVCLKNAGVSPAPAPRHLRRARRRRDAHHPRRRPRARARRRLHRRRRQGRAHHRHGGVALLQKLFGRTGIIYIQDYWKRHGETTPTGDHIDVWNGYRSSTKWLMEWFSWLGYYSNYVQAKEVWFWDVK